VEHFLTNFVAHYGYLAVFLLMAVGSACIPVPSEIVMLFGGAMASAGFATEALNDPSAQLSFWGIVIAGLLGTMVGSWFSYGMGYVGGRPLIDRFGRFLLIRPHEVDKAERWFERHGELAVFAFRMVPFARAFISLPAGVARMPFWRFSIYSLLGSIPWTVGLAWAGLVLGANWKTVEQWIRPVSIAFAVLFVGAVAWWIVHRLRQRRAAARLEAESPAAAAATPTERDA
jgi:membrane protein DedA with SNARE-associated domain